MKSRPANEITVTAASSVFMANLPSLDATLNRANAG
jgi:hypothetical protein